MEVHDKIELLKFEYTILVEDIRSRSKTRFALLGLFFTLLGVTAKLFQDENYDLALFAVGALSSILAFTWCRFAYLIKDCALQLEAIEAKIDFLSDEKELLNWYRKTFSQTWLMKICAKSR